MSDVHDNGPGGILRRRFGIQGFFAPSIDQLIAPGWDLSNLRPEWDDDTTYWIGFAAQAGVAAQFAHCKVTLGPGQPGSLRGMVDQIWITNPSGANSGCQLYTGPSSNNAPLPVFRSNHKESQGQKFSGAQTDNTSSAALSGTPISGQLFIPAVSTLILQTNWLKEIMSNPLAFGEIGVQNISVNQPLQVTFLGRTYVVAK